MEHKVHEGRNVKRFREMMGMKQDALAWQLGEEWTQKKISLIESKETIDVKILKQISDVLKMPVEALQNFDEEQAVNVIANTFNCTDFKNNSSVMNLNPVFDPIDKIIQLHEEKIALYERMLKEKDEMMAELKKLIK
mgnify:CR=1 FL=1